MIRHLLASSIELGHETLILSAWGCGAFGNPPKEIARLFKEELCRPRVYRRLRKVVFAILDDDRTNNFEVFSSAFRDFQEEGEGTDGSSPQDDGDDRGDDEGDDEDDDEDEDEDEN